MHVAAEFPDFLQENLERKGFVVTFVVVVRELLEEEHGNEDCENGDARVRGHEVVNLLLLDRDVGDVSGGVRLERAEETRKEDADHAAERDREAADGGRECAFAERETHLDHFGDHVIVERLREPQQEVADEEPLRCVVHELTHGDAEGEQRVGEDERPLAVGKVDHLVGYEAEEDLCDGLHVDRECQFFLGDAHLDS